MSKALSEGDSSSCQYHQARWLSVADEWLSQKLEMPRTRVPRNLAAQNGHGEGRGAEPSSRAPGLSRQQTARVQLSAAPSSLVQGRVPLAVCVHV